MFIVYENGKEIIRFNPIPDYWKSLEPNEYASWFPKAEDIASLVPGVRSDRIAPYLRKWPIEEKAHVEDAFESDPWQVVDFMQELGFVYPDEGEGEGYCIL